MTLNRIVSRLRKILSNGAADSVTIETLPRVGYRLIPPRGNGSGQAAFRGKWQLLVAAVIVAAISIALVQQNSRDVAPALVSTATASRMSPVTTLPGREINPAFSPDGSQLVFSWSKPGSTTWQLHIRVIGTESLLPLTGDDVNDRMPKWSPDGRQIAFIRYATDGSCSVNTIAPTGGPVRRITACDTDADPVLSWTPDGDALIFSGPQQQGAKGLDIIDLNSAGALSSRRGQVLQRTGNDVALGRQRARPTAAPPSFSSNADSTPWPRPCRRHWPIAGPRPDPSSGAWSPRPPFC